MRTRFRWTLAVGPMLLLIAFAVPWRASSRAHQRAAVDAERVRLAERIYREGVLPSGKPLRGLRPDGSQVSGAQAACVQCHRRSGMGMVEGGRIIPPIAGPFLYQRRARALPDLEGEATRGPDLAHAFGRNRSRVPYTDRTLVRAICSGIDSADRLVEDLMPRYVLSETEAQLLVDYLKQLSDRWSPGVTHDSIHFATVVTPGVDPVRRKAMVDVLQAFFSVRNAGNRLARMREERYRGAAHNRYRAWKLHVWELTGAPETWQAQLLEREQREPVFALISGVSDGSWAPVQAFCDERRVPCWFPTVDLPAPSESFYSVYFSKGVLLEAEMLASQLDDSLRPGGNRRVIEVRGDDAAAAGAAQALGRALGRSVRIEERVLRTIDAGALRAATADAGRSDVIVFWLHGPDLARLADVPAPAARVYFSATLGGGEQAPLPPAWKAQARLAYPFELPRERGVNLSRFHAWLATHGLQLIDERVQADAWLASQLMSEQVGDMLENLNRDYLLERAESLLSNHLQPAMYHRLSLGPTQRFASKGGYITRFSADGGALVAETAWIVP